jgi:hypothetical protein
MFQFILMTSLYSIGMLIGFFLVPFFTRVPLDEKAGIKLDEQYDQLFLSFKFLNEVDEAPMSELTTEELKGFRDKILHYEIPFLGQKVMMYYDQEKETFCYYANTNIIYKYLMVVARKYVLDFQCKQIFKEMENTMKKEEKSVQFSAFVAKPGKVFLEKEMNKFLYLGNLDDYKPISEKPKDITYSEYLKQMQTHLEREEELVGSSNPETQ